MKTLTRILFCFWVMWSGTKVTKNEKGGLTFTGGVFSAISSPVTITPPDDWRYVGKGECLGWLDIKNKVAKRIDCELAIPRPNDMPGDFENRVRLTPSAPPPGQENIGSRDLRRGNGQAVYSNEN